MSRLEFSVQGSASEPYRVVFEKVGDNLNAYCSCPAGANGQCCKHRLRLLSGNPEGVISDSHSLLNDLASWLVGTNVETALVELIRAEDAQNLAKQRLAKAKKLLAAAFRA